MHDDLESLAACWGVTRSYHDGTGRERRASDDALLAVLRSLGAPLERIDDAADALRAHSGAAAPAIAAVTCLQSGKGGAIAVREGTAPARIPVVLRLEDGQTFRLALQEQAGGGLRVDVPADTPIGYHSLEIDLGRELLKSRLLVAPARFPAPPRSWALFAPLYGIDRGSDGHDFACYGDLAVLAQWMTASGASSTGRDGALVATLPLLACFFEEPFEPSPYSPISRAFWSELYVDPACAPECGGRPQSRPHRNSHAGDARRIDYRVQMRLRRAQIEQLLIALDSTGGARLDAFERDLIRDEDLSSWASFRAAVEHYGCTWERWPSPARAGTLEAGLDFEASTRRYHAYAQWLAREQVAAAAGASPAGLLLDLPLGCHGGGYDTWRYAGDFAPGISAGAPPDALFEGGQNWAFPPLHPVGARQSGYAAFRAALRHHFLHASVLRIDHVMGLDRLFWIPDGSTAADGVYVRYHGEELWSILAIEAARARAGRGAAVVGEDLGTVPDATRSEIAARGALRMHIVPFECRGHAEPVLAAPPVSSLASLGTHDMEPFAAWWERPDTARELIANFLRRAGRDCREDAPGTVLRALLAWLSASDATIVSANLEDFWLERARQNLPGTAAGDSNWQRPFARCLADITTDRDVAAMLAAVRGSDTAADTSP